MNNIKVTKRNLRRTNSELRNNNQVPGTVYGPQITATPVKMPKRELLKATITPGEIYDIHLDQGRFMVKIGELQRDPVSREITHFSLVTMPQNKVSTVEVPILLKGTPKGVQKGGTLVVFRDELMLSGKPRRIPHRVIGDTSGMDIGDKLTVNDLVMPDTVLPVEAGNEVVAICKPPVKQGSKLLDDLVKTAEAS